MKQEIERKFLVTGEGYRQNAETARLRQGYFPTQEGCTIRVRVAGVRAFLTIKEARDEISRMEYEYDIPVQHAENMLHRMCRRPIIEKTRYRVYEHGLLWEVDEFHGANEGLVVAEVELTHRDQPITLPAWAGREVSGDHRYYNAYLAQHPYSTW